MSHKRLRTKLEGYLTYTEHTAWRELGPYQPALLLITTSRVRADTFLRSAGQLLGSKKWAPHTGELVVAVCARARDMTQVHTARCWGDPAHEEALTLAQVLNAARAPHDRRAAAQAIKGRAFEDERDRLVTDPEHLRAHLREHDGLRRAVAGCLPREAGIALELLAAGDASPTASERSALRDLGRQLMDHLPAGHPTPTLSDVDPTSVELLVVEYRREQERELRSLVDGHGDGPHLRQAAGDLQAHGLRTATQITTLGHDGAQDARSYEQQADRRAQYLAFREDEAHRRSHDQPLTTRLRRGDEHYLDAIDAVYLRRCDDCAEVAYPNPQLASATRGRYLLAAERCSFCGGALRQPRPNL